MESGEFVVVLTTIPADADPSALAQALVKERLAACVSVLPPMTSIYRWKGDVETATERQLVIKTASSKTAELQQRLLALHSYDVPEFLILPVTGGSDAYLSWIREACGER